MPRCEPFLCDDADFEDEDSGGGASRHRANFGGHAVVASAESGSVDTEVSDLVQKDPFGELISIWLVRRWWSVVFSWPSVLTALIASDPNVIQCTAHRARAGARQSLSEWMVPWRLAPVRHSEARGRWEDKVAPLEGA